MTNEPITSTEFEDIVFPDEPTTTHIQKVIAWLLDNADPYVMFMNNGPFVFGTNIRFVISNEGDHIDTPVAMLNTPMFVLHEHMPEELTQVFEKYYNNNVDEDDETTAAAETVH